MKPLTIVFVALAAGSADVPPSDLLVAADVPAVPVLAPDEVADNEQVRARDAVRVIDHTGVEMEALTAATVAALTIYDMCKSYDRGMAIVDIWLLSKSGGKSGDYARGTADGPA